MSFWGNNIQDHEMQIWVYRLPNNKLQIIPKIAFSEDKKNTLNKTLYLN